MTLGQRLFALSNLDEPTGLLAAPEIVCNALDTRLEFRLVLDKPAIIPLEEVLRPLVYETGCDEGDCFMPETAPGVR